MYGLYVEICVSRPAYLQTYLHPYIFLYSSTLATSLKIAVQLLSRTSVVPARNKGQAAQRTICHETLWATLKNRGVLLPGSRTLEHDDSQSKTT